MYSVLTSYELHFHGLSVEWLDSKPTIYIFWSLKNLSFLKERLGTNSHQYMQTMKCVCGHTYIVFCKRQYWFMCTVLVWLLKYLVPCTHTYVYVCVCVCVLVAQSCPTFCDPKDCSPPGCSVHGILQARTLEWVAIYFSMYIWTNEIANTFYHFPVWCYSFLCGFLFLYEAIHI